MFKFHAGLMNSVYDRVSYAPTDFGLGGGAGTEDEPEFDDIPDSDADNETTNLNDDEIKDDDESYMSDLLGAGEDDTDEDEEESPEQIAAAETAMAEELMNNLKNLTLPADLIPEDFDASNPAQLIKLLQDVQINTATNAVKLVLKPVQATLEKAVKQMRREARSEAQSAVGGNSVQQQLRAAFPGIDSPITGPVVKMTFEASRRKHPNDTKAALAATRKALAILGVDASKASRNSAQTDETSTGLREGSSALDSFGLRLPPRQTAQHRATSRMRPGKK